MTIYKKFNVAEEVKNLQAKKLKLSSRLHTKTSAGQVQVFKVIDDINEEIYRLNRTGGPFNMFNNDR